MQSKIAKLRLIKSQTLIKWQYLDLWIQFHLRDINWRHPCLFNKFAAWVGSHFGQKSVPTSQYLYVASSYKLQHSKTD